MRPFYNKRVFAFWAPDTGISGQPAGSAGSASASAVNPAASSSGQTPRPSQPSAEPDTMIQKILYEVKKVIVGQDFLLERLMVALLSQGHLLVEGVPGLAKTLTIKTLAKVLKCDFKRIQFTPDLLPADLIGTRIFNQKTSEFSTWLGPVFTNLLLADEINRSPAKVQSALLEVMEERQVSIGGETHQVPRPFLVMATQNPIETEGTYSLPEAQVDRFMLKVVVKYPTDLEEFVIVERMAQGFTEVKAVATLSDVATLKAQADKVYVDPSLIAYAVNLSNATREPAGFGLPELAPYISYGASPRASINMILAARALACVRGREFALAKDVAELAFDVMRHRLVLSYEALADGVSADDIISKVLAKVPTPEQDNVQHLQTTGT